MSHSASIGAALVNDTRAFLIAWRRILSGAGRWSPAEVEKLRQQSKSLAERARIAGVGGLAHHLHSCEECFAAEPVDRAELSRRLRNVSELTSQLRQEVDAGRVQPISIPIPGPGSIPIPPPAHASERPAPRGSVPPPPLLTVSDAPASAEKPAAVPKPPATPSAPQGALLGLKAFADRETPKPATPPAEAPSKPPRLDADSLALPPLEGAREPSAGAAPQRPPATSVGPPRPGSAPRASPGGLFPSGPPRPGPAVSAAPAAPLRPAASPSPAAPAVPEAPAVVPPTPVVSPVVVSPPAPPVVVSPLVSTPAPAAVAARSVAVPPADPIAAPEPGSDAAPGDVPLASAALAGSEPLPPLAPEPPLPPFAQSAPLAQTPQPPFAQSAPAPPLAQTPLPPFAQPGPVPPLRLTPVPPLRHTPLPPQPPMITDSVAVSAPPVSPVPPLTPGVVVPNPASVFVSGQAGPMFGPAAYAPPRAPPPRMPQPPIVAGPRIELAPNPEPVLADLEERLERLRRTTDPALRASPAPALEGFGQIVSKDSDASELLARAAGRRTGLPWWSGALAVLLVGAAVVGVLVSRGKRAGAPELAPADPAAMGSTAGLPMPRLTDEPERLRALLAQIHGHGGAESPELADLLDEEAALIARALEAPCIEGSVACTMATRAREVLVTREERPVPARPPAPLGAWLTGLKLPGIGVKDDPKVRELVEYHTENTVGREAFQVLLFQCGAYQDLIQQLLLRHALPLDLMALAMVESGCVFDAESAVGARGLWQFMPATARAYHLRIQPGVIDERISPTKSTDAALEFLGDLRRKLGSWELAMASYNMGPFGLIARLRQAGAGADYWDLVNAGRLPAETAQYVPKVQAFALILANLERFGFQAAQLRAPEVTSDLEVPAGTRLGLIARAAGTSTTKIRELNPEFLGDSVPNEAGAKFRVRVPKEGVFRAREALPELLSDDGHPDRCVPHSFDWGKQRFTKAMAERCAHLAETR